MKFFITATGTDIGKTLVTAALTWQLRAKGVTVKALKPIASGFDMASAEHSDAGQLLAAQGLPLADIDTISPWRFAAPLSPDMAAQHEGKSLSFDEVIRFCTAPIAENVLLIEGVGGVMTPITPKHTVLDWMEKLNIPVIVVTGSYVGAQPHIDRLACAAQSRTCRTPHHCQCVRKIRRFPAANLCIPVSTHP
jgi:dethiobiotin synthetase